MPRWEPDARRRLVEAALDLFEERGYDDAGVKEIAERAGLTKTTFFRQFPDKREVLSAGQEEHVDRLVGAIVAAPTSATPWEAVEAAVRALALTFQPERRAFAARVEAVTAVNAELRERAGLKYAGYVTAMRNALADRGTPSMTAAVAADLALLAFRAAFERWAGTTGSESLLTLVDEALTQVLASSQALGTTQVRAPRRRGAAAGRA